MDRKEFKSKTVDDTPYLDSDLDKKSKNKIIENEHDNYLHESKKKKKSNTTSKEDLDEKKNDNEDIHSKYISEKPHFDKKSNHHHNFKQSSFKHRSRRKPNKVKYKVNDDNDTNNDTKQYKDEHTSWKRKQTDNLKKNGNFDDKIFEDGISSRKFEETKDISPLHPMTNKKENHEKYNDLLETAANVKKNLSMTRECHNIDEKIDMDCQKNDEISTKEDNISDNPYKYYVTSDTSLQNTNDVTINAENQEKINSIKNTSHDIVDNDDKFDLPIDGISHEQKAEEIKIDPNFINHESQLFKSKSGGIYLPPAKLKQYQQEIFDKNSEQYQRLYWIAVKKTINGLMNKINSDNIINVIHELLEENIIRCRGILVRSLIINQEYSPMYSNIYAALISVINTKLPQIGELLLKRLVVNFKLYYGGNLRQECINIVRFIAHLTNQYVCDEILVLEILFTLLDEPTTISIEVACGLLRECGQFLDTNCARASNAIYERLRTLLYEADIPKRSQYMIEVLFAIRRDKYKDYPSIIPDLQLIDEEDQYTHKILLEEDYDPEKRLNLYKFDPDFVKNEEKYQDIRREVLGDAIESSEDEIDSSDNISFSETDENQIHDHTEAQMIALRRTIYLTVNSSLDYDECVHKIMKLNIKPHQFIELARMLVDCCAQLRTYEKFFGFICERICLLNADFRKIFAQVLNDSYENAHHLETMKIRNIAKLYAHLMSTKSLDWSDCLKNVKITEQTTTSSQRILLKILFQELASNLGIDKLHKYLLAHFYSGKYLDDETVSKNKYKAFLQAFHKIGENDEEIEPLIDFNICQQLFPTDNLRDTRFSVNFFTAIDLGPLTDEMRTFLDTQEKNNN